MTLLPPSPKTMKKINTYFYQDPEITAKDVNHLKDWLSKQQHLPQIDDDIFLERFLYLCKYRLSQCKNALDAYYTMRGALPELHGNRDPMNRELQDSCETVIICLLPKLSPEGYRISIMGLLDPNPEKYNLQAHLKYGLMLIDLHIKMESWCGDIMLFDFKHVTMSHFTKSSPLLMKKFLICLQKAYPHRIKGIHFINAPSFMDKFLALIKPFLKTKLKNRIHVHTSADTLCDIVPKELLPLEYGGQEVSIRVINDSWKKAIERHRDWFLAEEKKITDESKRSGTAVSIDELFGVEGSFRQLIID